MPSDISEIYRQILTYNPIEFSEPEVTSIQYIGEPEVQYIDTTAWSHNDIRNTYIPIRTRPFTKEEKIRKEFKELTKILKKPYDEDCMECIPF